MKRQKNCATDPELKKLKNSEPIGPGGCSFWNSKKNRFCKMVAKQNAKFCGQHLPHVDDSRAECPHCLCTVQRTRLEKHLKKCNILKEKSIIPKYYQKGVNIDDFTPSSADEKWENMKLSEFERDDVLKFISDVFLLDGSVPSVKNQAESYFEPMENEIKKLHEEKSTKSLKHFTQQAALLQKLNESNLLQNNICYIELGAGKGGLTERIAEHYPNATFVLVDRATVRQKKEKEEQFINDGRNGFERVKGDIADLALEQLPETSAKVCIAKHLCGEATDLAIRGSIRAKNLCGLVIASCCHHRCRWGTFNSRDNLSQKFNSAKYFRLLSLLSSWHTCGFEKSNDELVGKYDLTVDEKQRIGAICKFVLDQARRDFLRVKYPNFSVELEQYCALETSLECRVIIMSPNI